MTTQVSAFGWILRIIPDWITIFRKAHPQSGNYHPYGSLVGNYHPDHSSQLGSFLDSSLISQLPCEKFIPYWVTASLFMFWGGKPLSRIIVKTYLWVLKAHPQLGNCSWKANPWLSNCRPSFVTECSPHLDPMLMSFEKGKPRSRMIEPTLASGLPTVHPHLVELQSNNSTPWLKSSLHLEVGA